MELIDLDEAVLLSYTCHAEMWGPGCLLTPLFKKEKCKSGYLVECPDFFGLCVG